MSEDSFIHANSIIIGKTKKTSDSGNPNWGQYRHWRVEHIFWRSRYGHWLGHRRESHTRVRHWWCWWRGRSLQFGWLVCRPLWERIDRPWHRGTRALGCAPSSRTTAQSGMRLPSPPPLSLGSSAHRIPVLPPLARNWNSCSSIYSTLHLCLIDLKRSNKFLSIYSKVFKINKSIRYKFERT